MTVLFALGAIAAPLAVAPSASAPDRSVIDRAALRAWYEDAKCLVKRQGPLAERILATKPESFDSLSAFMTADTPAQCFTQQSKGPLRIPSNATRGAIAEALLARDFSAMGVRRGNRVATVFASEGPPENGPRKPAEAHAKAMLALAECVAQTDPALSFAVFGTEVGSDEENRAVRALVPAISQCLPPGFEFPTQAPVLRSYLAEAAYRVSVRQVAGANR
jgi:hypothetical protein